MDVILFFSCTLAHHVVSIIVITLLQSIGMSLKDFSDIVDEDGVLTSHARHILESEGMMPDNYEFSHAEARYIHNPHLHYEPCDDHYSNLHNEINCITCTLRRLCLPLREKPYAPTYPPYKPTYPQYFPTNTPLFITTSEELNS